MGETATAQRSPGRIAGSTPCLDRRFAATTFFRLVAKMSKAPIAEPNNHGEIAGHGPVWACNDFGTVDHDYQSCPDCRGRYRHHLGRQITEQSAQPA